MNTFTLTTTRETLLPALTRALGAVARRSTIPILDNVLLRTEGPLLTVTGTDLESEIVCGITPASASGALCLPALRLTELVKLLPAGASISFASDGERCTIKSGRSRYTLPALAADTYPAFDRADHTVEIELPAGILADMMRRVAYAMAHKDVRYYLVGMLLQIRGDELSTVASDGFRLSFATYTLPHAPAEGGEWIIPSSPIPELLRALDGADGDVALRLGSNSAQFQIGETRFSTKLLEARYPDVRRVLIDPPHTLTVARDEFIATLRRVMLVAHTEYRGVRLQPSIDTLNLSASHADQDGDDSLPATWQGPDDMTYGFNGGYLLDLAGSVTTDDLVLHLGAVDQIVRVDTEGDISATHVVMPMRL